MQVEYVQIYHGPNRHAERALIEQVVSCNADVAARIVARRTGFAKYIVGYVADCQDPSSGDLAGRFTQAMMAFPGSPMEVAARCYARLTLLLQNLGGHPVSWDKVDARSGGSSFRVWYEFDDHEVALKAGELALRLLLYHVGSVAFMPTEPCAGAGTAQRVCAALVWMQARPGYWGIPGDHR